MDSQKLDDCAESKPSNELQAASIQEIEKSIQDLIDIQLSPGNYDYDPYMYGMANGLILAQSCVTGISPEYAEAPEVWGEDKREDKVKDGAAESKPKLVATSNQVINDAAEGQSVGMRLSTLEQDIVNLRSMYDIAKADYDYCKEAYKALEERLVLVEQFMSKPNFVVNCEEGAKVDINGQKYEYIGGEWRKEWLDNSGQDHGESGISEYAIREDLKKIPQVVECEHSFEDVIIKGLVENSDSLKTMQDVWIYKRDCAYSKTLRTPTNPRPIRLRQTPP